MARPQILLCALVLAGCDLSALEIYDSGGPMADAGGGDPIRPRADAAAGVDATWARDAGDAGDAGVSRDAVAPDDAADSGARFDAQADETGPIDVAPSDALPADALPEDAAGTDAQADAGQPAPVMFAYPTSNFSATAIGAGALVDLHCGVSTFNSTTHAFGNWCGPEPSVLDIAGGSMVLLTAAAFTIEQGAELQISGGRPVIVAVYGDALVAGVLSANASGATAGAGASTSTVCGPSLGGSAIGSAGSGAGGGDGSDGGDGNPEASGGDPGLQGPVPNDTLIPLSGGCAGGRGGGQAPGGGGGGAVQVSAAGRLTVQGVVSAAGGGGQAAIIGGAGGGGSGGAILLEADRLDVGVSAGILTNGGGGGGGGDTIPGMNGSDGSRTSTVPAHGGAGAVGGGAGGNGAALNVAATDGAEAALGSGGGGGGLGVIRLNAASRCRLLSTKLSGMVVGNHASGCP